MFLSESDKKLKQKWRKQKIVQISLDSRLPGGA